LFISYAVEAYSARLNITCVITIRAIIFFHKTRGFYATAEPASFLGSEGGAMGYSISHRWSAHSKAIRISAVVVLCLIMSLAGATDKTAKSSQSKQDRPDILVPVGSAYHGAGNVWCTISNWGWIGDDNVVLPTMERPGGSGNMHLYQGGLWIAGLDENGLPHCTAGNEMEFYPLLDTTRIEAYTAANGELFTDEEYVIVVASGEQTDNFSPAYTKWYDADLYGQPGVDDDGDGAVDEDPLDYIDNDGDGLINEDFASLSDEDTYAVYSDLWLARHNSGETPLGVEVIERTYAWSDYYSRNFLVFNYEIINVGISSNEDNENPHLVIPDTPQDLTDVHVGIYMDGDISTLAPGTYWYDDLVYYRLEHRVSYMYDGDDPEREGDDTGESGLSSGYLWTALLDPNPFPGFWFDHDFWTIDDDPSTDGLKYNMMAGDVLASTSVMFPYDWRFLQSVGPFDLPSGDTLQLTWAMGVGDGYDNMLYDVRTANWMYGRGFDGTILPPIFPPTDLTVLGWGNAAVALTWGGGQNEYLEGWNIYRATDLAGEFIKLNSTPLVESSYRDSSIALGNMYHYAVTNVDSLGNESEHSNTATVSTGAPVPPSGLAAAIEDGAIRLSWAPPPDASVEQYHVYRSHGTPDRFKRITIEPADAESFLDNTAAAGETYYYTVTALSPQGYESLQTGWVRITLQGGLAGRGVLLVDDDDATPDREIDHTIHRMFQAFDSEDWDVAEQGIPAVADLQNYSTIVWYADDAPYSFYSFAHPETDPDYVENPLPAYLDMGGNLWLMGSEILYYMAAGDTGDIFRAGGFAREYLHLLDGGDVDQFFTGLRSLGVPGFSSIGIPGLATGTGYPDTLSPSPEAQAIYALEPYGENTISGIFYDGDDHKVILFGVNASFIATNDMALTLSPEDMAAVAEHALGTEFGEGLMENPPPLPPKLLEVTRWGDDYIDLSWSVNVEADFLGYRLYRSGGEDTLAELVNAELLRDQHTYRDSLLTETVEYRYHVTGVDLAFQESKPSMVVMEIPGRPHTPGKLRIARQIGNDIELAWDPDSLADLAGYNLYYRIGEAYSGAGGIGDFFRLNDSFLLSTSYSTELSTGFYFFSLTIVDQDSLESYHSEEIPAFVRGPLSDRILLIDNFSWTPGCYATHNDIAAQIDSGFMNGIDYTLWDVDKQGTDIFTPAGFGQYSSIILYTDGGYAAADYANLLAAYGQAGGNLMITGYQLADMGTEMLSALGFKPEYVGTGSYRCSRITGAPGTDYEGLSIDVPQEVSPRLFESISPEADHTSIILNTRAVMIDDWLTEYPPEIPCGVRSEMPGGNVIIILGQSLPFLDQTQQATKDFGWQVLQDFGEVVISRTEERPIPLTYRLYPCYPNPFNPTTIIRYDLPQAVAVSLVAYDLLGRDIVRLVDHPMEAGTHQVVWNGRDELGRLVPSGVYIVRMITPEYIKSIKMVLLK
jgi:fibronectin type 3 domain-containing protein